MNRSLWTQTLTETYCPPWTCPECRKGTLALVPKSVSYKQTAASRHARSNDDWEPDWVSYTFTAWAECKHPPCKQTFAIAGEGGAEIGQDEDGGFDCSDYFSPKACFPMPDIFEIPAKCPDAVKDEIRASFAVFWANTSACAGRLRVSLECLMNYVGAPKRKKNAKGKYFEIPLHARIDAYAANEPKVGPNLIALKWLGNTGSHVGEIKRDELLDAFEIMEHSLGEIIDKRSQRVAELAEKLTKMHSHRKRHG